MGNEEIKQSIKNVSTRIKFLEVHGAKIIKQSAHMDN